MAETVSRAGRLLDLLGLLVFLVGGGIFTRAWFGFRAVRQYQPSPGDRPWAATRLANGYLHLQHVGGAIMLAGIAVLVAAWLIAGRRGTRPDGAALDSETTG